MYKSTQSTEMQSGKKIESERSEYYTIKSKRKDQIVGISVVFSWTSRIGGIEIEEKRYTIW